MVAEARAAHGRVMHDGAGEGSEDNDASGDFGAGGTTEEYSDSHAYYDSDIYLQLAGVEDAATAGGGSRGAGTGTGGGAGAGGSSSNVGGMKSRKPKWYGAKKFGGLHYLRDIEIAGRLIVIEGPDASGRSTQIELLTTQLEAEGYAVLNTGLTRSEIIGQGILEAKRNISLGVRTLAMFYAADFADQLEHKIIPALQAGYVVLADRYIYTLMARNTVRGIRRSWSSNLYSFALVPDMTFYLDVDPYVLVHRVFAKRQSLDYYESGADMGISKNMYDSFIKYQQRLAREFGILEQKYGLNIINGNRPTDVINAGLKKQVLRYLSKA
ncbi:MAG: dTMP kinase [Thaumarchaeota archaeon]|nr:dTMP kinase [Nitrososphaerota archaeon]